MVQQHYLWHHKRGGRSRNWKGAGYVRLGGCFPLPGSIAAKNATHTRHHTPKHPPKSGTGAPVWGRRPCYHSPSHHPPQGRRQSRRACWGNTGSNSIFAHGLVREFLPRPRRPKGPGAHGFLSPPKGALQGRLPASKGKAACLWGHPEPCRGAGSCQGSGVTPPALSR